MTWQDFIVKLIEFLTQFLKDAAAVPDGVKEDSQPEDGTDVTDNVDETIVPARWYMSDPVVRFLKVLREKEAGSAGYNANYQNDDKWILTNRPFDQVRELGRSQVTVQREASSAIGGYQFITATLDSLKSSLGLTGAETFNEVLQDDLAVALMIRRGFMRYLRGEITASEFCNNLAKEWASLPVVTRIQGAKRIVNPGESYYAGDGLNKALISVNEAMTLVVAMRTPQMIKGASK